MRADKELRQRKIPRKNDKTEQLKNATEHSKSEPHSFTWLVFIVLVLVLSLGYLNSPVKAVYVNVQDVEFTGAFAVNNKLTKGKRIKLAAPESIEEDTNGNLFTGLIDGRIVKIHRSLEGVIGEGEIENITGGVIPNTEVTDKSAVNGRPLGIRLRGKNLYVMDAVYGFYVIDVETRALEFLVKPNDVSPTMRFPDDLDISADGKYAYFTDASYYFSLPSLPYDVLQGSCSGRIFKFDIQTKDLKLLASDLCFPNGVQLTKDETMLIVPETHHYRISWIEVKSGKKIHVLSVPAMPDNVRTTGRGTYWVGATNKQSIALRILSKWPVLRQIIAGIIPIRYIIMISNVKHNMLFEVDDNGNILSSLHDPNGDLTLAVAQATVLSDGRIALGTYRGSHLVLVENSLNEK